MSHPPKEKIEKASEWNINMGKNRISTDISFHK